MPTYEYRCDACEHEFEELQSITAAPLKKCPECGKKKLQRLIGAGTGFIFRGSGFYITDYRSDSYKAAAKADQEPSKSDSKDSAGKSKDEATKPEAKKDTGATTEKKSQSKPAKSKK